ncbi:hypothetical protein MPTK1_6g19110 [Marchantia polymorpha subsp. ruderalis]|uniref:Uncharacterized protein n=2 Tax=Marchantia polymorpha TaxID=3197 RepID=A0AAF6BTP3_MARPO|nr:hypothetical protein MARPO_0045s0152 [Marchantia polymorpha]BBN15377.1 hypothetical protein Mp_6g19110 [Marchantia polymorpha subsp. ruderalis]|eukprot:PTQ39511.1 hypothetical protein MARPO_0045s0152 [Marchantia polymorpha]
MEQSGAMVATNWIIRRKDFEYGNKIVVIGIDDGGHSRVYVGDKKWTENFVEKAGLNGGKLCVKYVEGFAMTPEGANLTVLFSFQFRAMLERW